MGTLTYCGFLMYKKRTFGQDKLLQMDKLVHYLFKNKIPYTFHVFSSKENRNDLVFSVFWFEESRYI